MARKHFDDYYNKVYAQFHSLQQVFDDMAKEVDEGIIEPERIEQLKLTIEPIKNSYQTLSYIKYLLDMPARKQKEPKYRQMNKKLLALSKEKSGEAILKNNRDILNKLNN